MARSVAVAAPHHRRRRLNSHSAKMWASRTKNAPHVTQGFSHRSRPKHSRTPHRQTIDHLRLTNFRPRQRQGQWCQHSMIKESCRVAHGNPSRCPSAPPLEVGQPRLLGRHRGAVSGAEPGWGGQEGESANGKPPHPPYERRTAHVELGLWASPVILQGGGRLAPRREWRVSARGSPPHPSTVFLGPAPCKLRWGRDHRLNHVPPEITCARIQSSGPRAFRLSSSCSVALLSGHGCVPRLERGGALSCLLTPSPNPNPLSRKQIFHDSLP